MADHSLFVDFMYAVAVGTALPRINDSSLSMKSPVFWGIWFFIAVFLEDFYLYHTRVAPLREGSPPSATEFVMEMAIIAIWYIGQASLPTHVKWYLRSFALFFAAKLAASMILSGSYQVSANWAFAIPTLVGFGLSFRSEKKLAESHWYLLLILAIAWIVTTTIWWTVDPYFRLPTPSRPLPPGVSPF